MTTFSYADEVQVRKQGAALINASKEGNVEEVKKLLTAGVNVNTADNCNDLQSKTLRPAINANLSQK